MEGKNEEWLLITKKKKETSGKKPDKNHPKQVSNVKINIDGDRRAASVLKVSHEGAHPFT